MDMHVNGGFVPSSLAALVAALPVIRPIGSVAIELQCTDGRLEHLARRGRIAPPMLFGTRRVWLADEVTRMLECRNWQSVPANTGLLQLEQRIGVLAGWLDIVATCGNRFDSEYIPASDGRDRPRDQAFSGRGSVKAACRDVGSAFVWHRLPCTYGSQRHRADDYAHLASGRSGISKLIRTVDVVEWNLATQLNCALNTRTRLTT